MQTAPAEIFSENESLQNENASLRALLEQKTSLCAYYEEDIARLTSNLAKLQRQQFGVKSERWESEEQVLLFNEVEESAAAPATPHDTAVEVKPFTRKRGKRKPLSKDLPREVVVLDILEAEKIADDGTTLMCIGREVSEKLVFEPAKTKVIETHRLKYAHRDWEEAGVKIAALPASIIPKSIVTPSLLAQIVTAKYADALPLYRQEQIFNRLDIELPRSTMARWVVQAAKVCQPLWNVLEEKLLCSSYVSCDETPVQVLKEKDRRAQSKSWMWVRTTPSAPQKIILFDYDPHRSAEVAKKLWADYEGYFQCDGYQAYNGVERENTKLTRLGCAMHARRKFFDAQDAASKGKALANEGLLFFQKLYAIEDEAKPLTWDERFALRGERAAPLWEEIKLWATTQTLKVPPKSKVGQAFAYLLSEYQRLTAYLAHGMLEIDNGFAERAIKYFAIGRKNWLFADSEHGAHASSLFYSFVVTARTNGVNPYDALNKIFDEIPRASSIEDYERIAQYLLVP